MKNIATVFRKEFYRVISDRRLIFTAILLPGLAIYLMYSLLGNVVSDRIEENQNHNMIIYEENMPVNFRSYLNTNGVTPEYHEIGDLTQAELEVLLLEGDADLVLRFEESFYEDLLDDSTSDVVPSYTMLYNPGEDKSSIAYSQMQYWSEQYRKAISMERYGEESKVFLINDGLSAEDFQIQDEKKAIGKSLANLLPMLLIMFLFSGAMSIGPDSIAGEKERGTIATLLVTPIKRSEIAIGKVLSLSVISLFSATSSFIGIIFGLQNLMQDTEFDLSIYGINDYLAMFVVILSTVLFIVGLISVISAYAKTIKEASLLIMPVYFVSIAIGMTTMMSGEANENTLLYVFPIFNSVNMIISVLTFEIETATLLLTIISNIVFVSIAIYILNKMFQSEKIMFAK